MNYDEMIETSRVLEQMANRNPKLRAGLDKLDAEETSRELKEVVGTLAGILARKHISEMRDAYFSAGLITSATLYILVQILLALIK